MESPRENLILSLSFQFSLNIIVYTEKLEQMHKFGLAKQLFRSGTSIGANVRESQYAESKADFIHKLKIAEKESAESAYWLDLCEKSKNYPDCLDLKSQLIVLRKILGKIIKSSKS